MTTHRDTDEEVRQLKLSLNSNGHLLTRDPVVPVEVLLIKGKPFISHNFYNCAICGEHPDVEVTDTEVIVKNPCPYPDGITTEIVLSVPSGRIIVTDDLRPL